MRLLGIVGILVALYLVYLLVGVTLIKPVFKQFHEGVNRMENALEEYEK